MLTVLESITMDTPDLVQLKYSSSAMSSSTIFIILDYNQHQVSNINETLAEYEYVSLFLKYKVNKSSKIWAVLIPEDGLYHPPDGKWGHRVYRAVQQGEGQAGQDDQIEDAEPADDVLTNNIVQNLTITSNHNKSLKSSNTVNNFNHILS